jgi:hypothetical protein
VSPSPVSLNSSSSAGSSSFCLGDNKDLWMVLGDRKARGDLAEEDDVDEAINCPPDARDNRDGSRSSSSRLSLLFLPELLPGDAAAAAAEVTDMM